MVIIGLIVLLESAKLFKDQIRRFVHVSTDEVYGESSATADRFTSESPLNPTNPYAATKVAAEFLVKSYRTSFGLPTIITRGNNVYGPKQYPEKLIPKFISLLAGKQPCPLHGNGTNRYGHHHASLHYAMGYSYVICDIWCNSRSFLYVSDVAHAFEIILFKGVLGEIYNIGSRFEISNKETTQRLLQLFKLDHEESKYITYVKDRAFNDFRYHIDPSNLEALGWHQRIDFAEGLELTSNAPWHTIVYDRIVSNMIWYVLWLITENWYMSHLDHWPDVKSALSAHPVFSEGVAGAAEYVILSYPIC